jgi:predicted kinase
MLMASLVLVRGLPGSGKSTFARKLAGFRHLEADMFFVGADGAYVFEPTKLKEAHAWCQEQCKATLLAGGNVVVSNTFVKRWEMSFYVNLAAELGVEVTEVTVAGSYSNVHGVPDAVVERMRSNWEL